MEEVAKSVSEIPEHSEVAPNLSFIKCEPPENMEFHGFEGIDGSANNPALKKIKSETLEDTDCKNEPMADEYFICPVDVAEIQKSKTSKKIDNPQDIKVKEKVSDKNHLAITRATSGNLEGSKIKVKSTKEKASTSNGKPKQKFKSRPIRFTRLGQSKNIFICYTCSFQAKTKPNLINHMEKHYINKCPRCDYRAKQKSEIKMHLLTHISKNDDSILKFKCNSCNYKSAFKKHYHRHLLIHKDSNEVTSFQCSMCPYRSKYKFELNNHKKGAHTTKDEITMLKCNLCSFETKRQAGLRKHYSRIHKNPDDIVMFSCTECTHKTKYRQNLKSHMLQHKSFSEVLTYNCELCSYQTKHKRLIKAHTKKHENNPGYSYDNTINSGGVGSLECSECHFKTNSSWQLEQHMLLHVTFKCDQCSYESSSSENYGMHLLVHEKSEQGNVIVYNPLQKYMIVAKNS